MEAELSKVYDLLNDGHSLAEIELITSLPRLELENLAIVHGFENQFITTTKPFAQILDDRLPLTVHLMFDELDRTLRSKTSGQKAKADASKTIIELLKLLKK